MVKWWRQCMQFLWSVFPGVPLSCHMIDLFRDHCICIETVPLAEVITWWLFWLDIIHDSGLNLCKTFKIMAKIDIRKTSSLMCAWYTWMYICCIMYDLAIVCGHHTCIYYIAYSCCLQKTRETTGTSFPY